jgi:ribosomal protein S18 acetylase RimI-like enzyme
MPADAGAIARVHVQAWFESYRGLVPDDVIAALSVERNAQMWATILDDDAAASIVRVVEDDDSIVGFGSACAARSPALGASGEVTSIYLLNVIKRQGIGRRLFTGLLTSLAARGHTSVGLWVLVNNQGTRRFYEALGGRPGATRDLNNGPAVLHEIAYVWDDLSGFKPRGP